MSKLFNEVKQGMISPEEAVKRAESQMGSRTYKPKSREDRISQYSIAKTTRLGILSKQVPFITPEFLPNFYLTHGLILVGGKSGRAKTTTGANILAGFLKHCPGRQAMIVSNEESVDTLYDRVACVLLGYSYLEYYQRRMSPSKLAQVESKVAEIADRLEIVTEGDHWDPSHIEDMKSILESAGRNQIGLVLVDYLQTITSSRANEDMESYIVSKRLGFYFKDYGKTYGVPVVVLAQLNDVEGSDFASRVQNDKTIFNHAFIAIEVKPDFETLTTEFIIAKDRFNGCTGKKVNMKFDGGRYVLDEEV